MTVKDAFEVKGVVSTGGSPKWKENVPQKHADAAQRLVDAGAIIFGKTNVPSLSDDFQTYNEIYGTTNNPWDLARTPGGSSGDDAA
jgi:amidase